MTRGMRHGAEYAYRAVAEYPFKEKPEAFGIYQTEGAARRAVARSTDSRATVRIQRAVLVWEDIE
jgi:hypothetical protein